MYVHIQLHHWALSESFLHTVGWRGKIEGEENKRSKGRRFKIVSKQEFMLSPRFPLSLSLSRSLSPLPTLCLCRSLTSLLLHTEKSAYSSSGIQYHFPPASVFHCSLLLCWLILLLLLLPLFLPFLPLFPLSSSSSSLSHHGEQITARPSWDHGCLPLQRSQRSVPESTCLCVHVCVSVCLCCL